MGRWTLKKVSLEDKLQYLSESVGMIRRRYLICTISED